MTTVMNLLWIGLHRNSKKLKVVESSIPNNMRIVPALDAPCKLTGTLENKARDQSEDEAPKVRRSFTKHGDSR